MQCVPRYATAIFLIGSAVFSNFILLMLSSAFSVFFIFSLSLYLYIYLLTLHSCTLYLSYHSDDSCVGTFCQSGCEQIERSGLTEQTHSRSSSSTSQSSKKGDSGPEDDDMPALLDIGDSVPSAEKRSTSTLPACLSWEASSAHTQSAEAASTGRRDRLASTAPVSEVSVGRWAFHCEHRSKRFSSFYGQCRPEIWRGVTFDTCVRYCARIRLSLCC